MGKLTNQRFLQRIRTKYMTNPIETNLYEFYKSLAFLGKQGSEISDDSIVIRNEPGVWPRLIYGRSNLLTKQSDPIPFHELMTSNNSPELLITNDSNIQEFDPIVRQHRFFPFASWKGMSLETVPSVNIYKLPESVRISKVETDEELEEWIGIVNEELLVSSKLDKQQLRSMLDLPFFAAWLLRKSGVGVSTILVFKHNTSNGLYFIATKKSFQKQGFGSLLVSQICRQLIESSEKPIVLHATRIGEKLYSKLGFKPFNHFFLYRKITPKHEQS